MRQNLSKFFATLDPASFWFGAACTAVVCLMGAMAWSIIVLWLENRRVRLAEEAAARHGKHSEHFRKEAKSEAAPTVIVPAVAPRPYRGTRTDTTEIPARRATGSTRASRH